MESVNKESYEIKDLKVIGVSVYADRAEVKRLIKTTLKTGKNEVTVDNVSQKIDQCSIRVDGRGPAIICEVQYKEKVVKQGDAASEKLKQLKAEKETLTKKRQELDDSVKILNRNGEILDGVANRISEGPTNAPDSKQPKELVIDNDFLDGLTKFLSFYGDNVTSVKQKIRNVNDEIKNVYLEIDAIDRKICEVGFGLSGDIAREVTILLESEKGGDVELDLIYQVYGAKWTPSYDIRVFTKTEEKESQNLLKIYYYGLVEQMTGEDWMETPLTLSTGAPSIGGVVPTLGTLTVGIYKTSQPRPLQKFMKVKRDMAFGGRARSGSLATNDQPCDEEAESQSSAYGYASELMPIMATATTQATESVMSTCFSIDRLADIGSDGTEHKVSIAIIDLQPRFKYEAVPSKLAAAFLTVRVINSSNYPLLPGSVNVYLDNSFVAKSSLKPVSPGEDFSCSLGVDPSIRLDYKPSHKFHEQSGFVSKSSTDTHEQKIEIKNVKKEAVVLKIFEQLPRSTDEKVKVHLINPELPKNGSDAKEIRLNADHNLEWVVKVNSMEKRDLAIKWKIDYPAGEKIEFRGR